MVRYLILVLLITFALPCQAEWRERRAALSEMHRVEEFRIFYSRSGSDALPDVEDANRNGTPDYVEWIARQLLSARAFYGGQLGLRHPLSSPRYRSRADFIDVNLLSVPLRPSGPPRRGIAYDELSSFARPQDAGRKVRVLVIDISNSLSAKNATAAHELFHLYQYGYTFFKNGWYLEGMARWAERLGQQRRGAAAGVPRSKAEIDALFQQTYEAAPLWRRLAGQMDRGGQAFAKAFLEELDRWDDTINAGPWKEADQRSSDNNIHVWRALRNTLNQPRFVSLWDEEVRAMMAIEL